MGASISGNYIPISISFSGGVDDLFLVDDIEIFLIPFDVFLELLWESLLLF